MGFLVVKLGGKVRIIKLLPKVAHKFKSGELASIEHELQTRADSGGDTLFAPKNIKSKEFLQFLNTQIQEIVQNRREKQ